MNYLVRKLTSVWPIFCLFLVVVLLFVTNYKSVAFLTGWDNLHPEFNFATNIKRSLFAVWQEYQGLGLLGGMGHASDLVHQLFLLLLSFILPLNLLRYIWTFLMLFVGASGAYYLIRFLCHPELARPELVEWVSGSNHSTDEMPKRVRHDMGALIGSLFYLLNLATIQTFYAPFEAFIAHYAALPWLLLSSILYFQKQNRKTLLFLVLVLLLSTPSAYIPTLFVVYILALTILVISLSTLNMNARGVTVVEGLPTARTSSELAKLEGALAGGERLAGPRILAMVKLYLIIFLINSFWLLPFFYFTFNNSGVNLNAKINQMATETIFLQNKEFGNIQDVALLKGFWFNNVDLDLNGDFAFMFAPWQKHLESPLVQVIAYGLFAIVLIGVVSVLLRKSRTEVAFAILFIFPFTMLATNTAPFSWIDELFRKIPLFNQAFRFPFTKFSSLAALTYAIFFTVGVKTLFSIIELRIRNYGLGIRRLIHYSLFVIPASLLIIFTFPAFNGHLFYEKNRLEIPQDYFDTFEFFKTQDPNTRIANFPQHTFWGWNFYKWGYGGSGFLWYGIQQPIIDRAFDVWSHTSENYYYELSKALYSKNPQHFEEVINKYQIRWLLVDKNVINPPSPTALFITELEEILKEVPSIQKEVSFGKIDIYKVNLRDNPQNFVFTKANLPSTNRSIWGEVDLAYRDLGNYVSSHTYNLKPITYFYPYRTLFSGKFQENIEFEVKETPETITFTSHLPASQNKRLIKIPVFSNKERIIPATIITSKNQSNQLIISLLIKSPKVIVEDKTIFEKTFTEKLFAVEKGTSSPLNLNINGVSNFAIDNEEKQVGTAFLSLVEDNSIVLADKKGVHIETSISSHTLNSNLSSLKDESYLLEPKSSEAKIKIEVPKVTDPYIRYELLPNKAFVEKNCQNPTNFRRGKTSSFESSEEGKKTLVISSKNHIGCLGLFVPNLPHKEGYAIFVDAKNLKGRPLHMWILNEDEDASPIDTYLPKNKPTSTFVLSPQDEFGRSYSLHFENISIGEEESVNAISRIALYPVPYEFITSLVVSSDSVFERTNTDVLLSVDHPNESLYQIVLYNETMKQSNNRTIILSQSYDPGWKAYRVESSNNVILNLFQDLLPFFFGEELKEHVMVNNWENGWVLENGRWNLENGKLTIAYIPQYLEYLGFALLLIILVFALLPSSYLTQKNL